jgi:hypothetical protein
MMVVNAFRSSWFRVHETLEFMGRLRSVARLPQYLMTAMLLGAEWVAEMLRESSGRPAIFLADPRLR